MDLQTKLMQCFVTYVSSDNRNIEIWAQTDAEVCDSVEKYIASNHDTLSDIFAAQLNHNRIEVGKYYLTHMKNDLRFYRVIVTHIRDNSALVSYIDFGNEEWVPFENLIEMNQAFQMKPLAAKYLLADVTPVNQNVGWNVEDVKQMLDEFVYSLFHCEIVDTVENTEVIRIYDENFGQPLVRKLVENSIAIKTIKSRVKNQLNDIESMSVTVPVNVNSFDEKSMIENKNKKTKLDIKQELDIHSANDIKSNKSQTNQIMINPITFKTTINLIGLTKSVHIMETLSHSFYCQLTEKFDEIQSLLANMTGFYDKLTDKSFELDVSKQSNGLIIAAKFSDDKCWYRAMICGINGSQIDVFYIDYGNKENVHIRDCKVLAERFTQLPRQAFHCSLINKNISIEYLRHLQNEFDVIDCEFLEFKDDIYNVNLIKTLNESNKMNSQLDLINKSEDCIDNVKKDNIYVKINFDSYPSREVISINNTSMPEETSHFEVKPESKQQKLLAIPSQFVSLGSRKVVYISVAKDIDSFYCQFKETYDELAALLENMTVFYSNLTNDAFNLNEKTIVEGLIIAALFTEDNSWYRARVLSKTENVVQVFYIDYGNEESVDVRNCKSLDEQFKHLPSQALKCSPKSKNISLEYLQQLQNEITEVNCEFFEFKDDIYQVNLVKTIGESNKMNTQLDLTNKSEEIINNVPNEMNSQLDLIDKRDEVIDNNVIKGDICLEINKDSYPSHEAILINNTSIPEETSHIEVKPESKQQNLSIPSQFVSLGSQKVVYISVAKDIDSFYCQFMETYDELASFLENMSVFYSNLTNEAFNLDENTIVDDLIIAAEFSEDNMWYRARVLSKTENVVQVFYIDYGNEESVDLKNCKLLDEQFKHLPSQALKCSLINENISLEYLQQLQNEITEVNCEFIEFKDDIYKVNLVKTLNESNSQLDLINKNENCIENGESNKMNSQFDLIDKTEEFIDNVEPNKINSQLVLINNNEDLIDNETKHDISVDINSDSHPSQEVISISKEIPHFEVKPESKQQNLSIPVPFVALGSRKVVYISVAKDINAFYCQFVETCDELTALLDNMTVFYSNLTNDAFNLNENTIVEGLIIAALFTEDNMWYRARVLSKTENVVQVYYIDYGNEESVDVRNCKLLDEQFKHLPSQALKCSQLNKVISLEHLTKLHFDFAEVELQFVEINDGIYEVVFIEQNNALKEANNDTPSNSNFSVIEENENVRSEESPISNHIQLFNGSEIQNDFESRINRDIKDSESVFSDSVYDSLNDLIDKIDTKETVEHLLIGFD